MQSYRNVVQRLLMLGMVTVLLSKSLRACPLCASDTAQQVRAGLFDGTQGDNLAVTVLPFLILVAVVVCTYYGLPPLPGRFKRQKPLETSRVLQPTYAAGPVQENRQQ